MSTAASIMSIVASVLIPSAAIGVILTGFGRNVDRFKLALIVLCVGCSALLVAHTLRLVGTIGTVLTWSR